MDSILLGLTFIATPISIFLIYRFINQTGLPRIWYLFLALPAVNLLLSVVMFFVAIKNNLPEPAGLLISAIIFITALLLLAGSYFVLPWLSVRLLSEQNIQSEAEKYRLMLETLPDPVALKDARYTYLLANPAMGRLLGKDSLALTGKTDNEFFPRPVAMTFAKEEDETLQSKQSRTSDSEVVGSHGRRWLRITRTPVVNKLGTILGLLVSAHDFTQLHQEEERLHLENRQAKALNEVSLGLMSHSELSPLLESILSWAGELGGTPHVCIGLVDETSSVIEIQDGMGGMQILEGARFKTGEDVPGKVLQSGQAVSIDDYRSWAGRSPTGLGQIYTAVLGVPIQYTTQMLGVLWLCYEQTGRVINSEEIELFNHFADLSALALQNAIKHQNSKQALSQSNRTNEILQYRLRLERLVAAASTHLINLTPEQIDEVIMRAVQTLGRYAGVDRCYLYLFARDGAAMELVADWNAEGIAPRRDGFFELNDPGASWLLDKLNRLETVYVPRLSDLPVEATETAKYFQAQGVKSLSTMPLVSHRAVVGYLGLEALHNEVQWTPDVLSLFKLSADMFVSALERKWVSIERKENQDKLELRLATLEQRNRESALIAEMGDLLQACRTADEAFPIVARYVRRLIPIGAGALYLIRNVQDPAERVALWGEQASVFEQELVTNECWGLRRGKPHLVTDPSAGPLCGHLHQPVQVPYLCVPLIAQGEAVGLLHLRWDGDQTGAKLELDAYQNLTVKITENIAPALSNLYLRDRLRSQAIRDPLTSLFNRRYMEETLEREIRRAGRHSSSVGVIFFDIDRMKPINDTYGHDAGDTLLKMIGNLLLQIFRGEDVACRYGGDEFTVIMPEASISDVWERAEQLRDATKKLELEHEGKRLGPITLSIGVSAFPDHGTSAEKLVQVSDQAAYNAKAEGGDRVMICRHAEE